MSLHISVSLIREAIISSTEPTGEVHPADRVGRIERVLEDVTARRVNGESVSDNTVMAEHADLMPELGEALRKLRQVKKAIDQARDPEATLDQDETAAPSPGESEVDSLTQSLSGYQILREIHRGGQGVVYQAIQESTKRKVAIKILLEGPYASRSARRRFEREIELIAQLKHPNIIGVFHSGRTPDGRQYCVMDYVRGVPLDAYVREKKLALENALALFAKVCEAVNYAHQKGVIHRDLKPSNILVDTEGEPRVLDFGLAKMVSGPAETAVSLTGQVVGTLPYMSPEQSRGNPDEIDIRTDVYALGVILYQMLTGQYPYPVAGQMADVLKHIAETPPTPPSRSWKRDRGVTERTTKRVRAGACPIDDEVQTIVLRTLAKERERRYQTAGELARDIGHYLNDEPIEAKRESGWYVLKKSLRKYRVPVTVGTIMVISIAAFGVVVSYYAHWERVARIDAIAAKEESAIQERVATEEKEKAEKSEFLSRQRLYATRLALALSSYEHREIDRLQQALDSCQPDSRHWEWYWLKKLADRSSLTFGTEQAPLVCAMSRDGELVASSNLSGNITIWTCDGQETRTIGGARIPVFALALHPSGKLVASVDGYGMLNVHDVEKRNKIWGPVATLLTGLGPKTISPALSFSPDGTLIAFGCVDKLVLWNAATGENVRSWRTHTGSVMSISFSSDGKHLVTGSADSTLKLWNVATGDELQTFTGHNGAVYSVAFSPGDKRIISGGEDKTIRLWDSKNGTEICVLNGHTGAVSSVAMSPAGHRVISGGNDRTIRVWEADSGEEALTLLGHLDSVAYVACGPSGKRILSLGGGEIKTWDLNLSPLPVSFNTQNNAAPINALGGLGISFAVNSDGTQMVLGQLGRVGLLGKASGTLRSFDLTSGSETHTFGEHRSAVLAVAFSSDGSRVLSGGFSTSGLLGIEKSGFAALWDASSGEQMRVFSKGATRAPTQEGNMGVVFAVAISPSGRFVASAGTDRVLRLWNSDTGEAVRTFSGHDGDIVCVAFSPDGNLIASGSVDGTVRVWRVANGGAIGKPLHGHSGAVNSIAWNPNSRFLVSAGEDNSISLWRIQGGTLVAKLRGHREAVNSVAYSSSGKRIISGSSDGTVKIWDAQLHEELLTLRGHRAGVVAVASTACGNRIVSCDFMGIVKLWCPSVDRPTNTLSGGKCL